MAQKRTLFTSGYLPFAQKDNFKIEEEDLSLIGTSEQSLLGMHMDEVFTQLPLLYLGDSMCFRTEIGSAGRDVNGVFRVHQFYKMEQIVYCLPEDVEYWHKKCLENEERILDELGIPYRTILSAAGDTGAPGSIKYDVEGWFPGQGRYRELTSNTNILDYQTRRGNIRYKIAGQKGFPYTISATGFTDRLILAIMENYQTADGGIKIPEKLIDYMDGVREIERIR
ncbi:MAG: aminoacyl--tRNA ligase-related protein [Negativicutes bacterium]